MSAEHPRIIAARAAVADTCERGTAEMQRLEDAIRLLTPHSREFWRACMTMARARRAWKSAANRKANLLDKMVRIHGDSTQDIPRKEPGST
jgi:hypothetical protein